MHFAARIGWAVLLLTAVPTRAETWRTTRGDTYTGKLSAVYDSFAVIEEKRRSRIVPISMFGDAEIERVADFIATKAQPAPWKESPSIVAKAVKGRLQTLRDGKLVKFDPGTRPEPDFYLVYFGAEWCPPCRAFSPVLVDAYQRLRAAGGQRFEVVFISSDRSASEMLRYVQHVNMPWPVLNFSHVGRVPALEQWAGTGIPCLVVVTREGAALFHSYRGEEYVGPAFVLQQFEQFLRELTPAPGAGRREMHRLAVVQHLRAAAGGARPAQPYVIRMDLRRYQTLEVKQLVATLDINERGEVTSAAIAPELPAVLNHALVDDAGTWLFLPAIEQGRAVAKKVQLPLKLGE